MRNIELFPCGEVVMPPSKSAAHRAVICAALADCGETVIDNISFSKDIDATLRCVRALGADIAVESDRVTVGGCLGNADASLDCGESGTTLRFLVPVAALSPGEKLFTGSGRLMERPLDPYITALSEHGVQAELRDGVLSVSGALESGVYAIPGNISSQFVSGLLLALPLLNGDSEIRMTAPLQSASYVGMTIDMMSRFGVEVENHRYERFLVKGRQKYRPSRIIVEADYSQAAFFLVAGALGCPCECLGLTQNSGQGDRKILDILKRSGINTEISGRGGITAKPGHIAPQVVDISDIPDLAPPLAALLAFCDSESRITNAERLRLKESDRLTAITETLNGLGARIVIHGDELHITGVRELKGGVVDSRGDHRIAMMAAVAAIRSSGQVSIDGDDCVSKSYPDFWRDFEREPRRHEQCMG